ncbi:hypothetical protein KTN05_12165 [Paracoccus sp. Z118]|uniref:hypothetical protein n=1 Tax=Paracoccus sp. Z118 TaxID=2851017 RepID=UPI001C2C63F0|nr:hypothetical protein [Paracoccus sp. Z118]MBV0892605.1 hypothetical protein [Paracoccus sp. Z118]
MAGRRSVSRSIHHADARDGRDKLILILAFVAGVVGGIILKRLGLHPFIPAGYSVAVLCGYALLTWYATHMRLEPEAIGDNCYYLGFLFTLTSLSVTLYDVIQASGETRADLIPGVISGFGVALASTIGGVFLRVLMMQFRTDLVVRERETRVEMDMAARQLRNDMSRSIRQIKSYTVEALQLAAEHETAMRKQTEALVADTREQMRAASLAASDALTAAIADTTRAQTEAAIRSVQQAVERAAAEMLSSAAIPPEQGEVVASPQGRSVFTVPAVAVPPRATDHAGKDAGPEHLHYRPYGRLNDVLAGLGGPLAEPANRPADGEPRS